ncbi:Ubiquitin family protein [Trichomonas vaginalis G3]|uniref:Ubiquitin family protein n=1 Tax=Trichomonas vaginalis (strain ATCC PRA-98 / G3) TaxID=412133 RepID=A2G7G2_TRIV3|nr:cellular macromolecule catabolic process [Trichomonas vaginalis G3]EAX86905.1 Ubiquitin family protein [Trichomonas vaginalis G3]KAI5524203.1 cellular macromolecule catabolic process [Trichomonas vaginalis G3]|eukprot:XP_001299835.1 Ubiquitin family protein [Trichomonas vaginalis G3]
MESDQKALGDECRATLIFVKTVTGKIYTFENVELINTLNYLKSLVQEQTGIKIEKQRLIFNMKEMKADIPIKDYGIKNENIIYLVEKVHPESHANPANQIELVTCRGDYVLFTDIDLNLKVKYFKYLIQEQEGTPVEKIRLIFAGKQLEAEIKLKDYGVKYGDKIQLVLRLCGAKPVIYLYPKEEIDAKVSIHLNDGDFSFVYPSFDEDNTWNVKALPSGEIVQIGKKIRYLFWETLFYPNLNMDKGFIIKGDDSVSFFEDKLKSMNLNDAEICDFVTYWCPKLCGYKYVKVCFQFENFDEMCPMNVEPKPDNINRVFFAALPLDSPCDIEPQELPTFNRDGFTVIEWGGTIVPQK